MQDLNVNLEKANESPERKKMSFVQRIVGVILAPSETMSNLIEKPRILFPILAMTLTTLLFYILRFPLYKEFMRKSIESNPAILNGNFTPEQIDLQVTIGSITGLIVGPIGQIIAWLVGTAILFGILKLLKGQGKLKQLMSITGYAFVISIIYTILILIISFFTNNLYMEMPLTSLGNLLPESMKGTFLFEFIKGIELFSIWNYIVIAIGVTLLSNLKKNKVYAIVFGLYGITIIFSGIVSSIGSIFK